jgi:hypothetical protein
VTRRRAEEKVYLGGVNGGIVRMPGLSRRASKRSRTGWTIFSERSSEPEL